MGAVQCEDEVASAGGDVWGKWGTWGDDVGRGSLSGGPLDRRNSDMIRRGAASGLQVISAVPH